jgi:cyanophycinase
MTLFLAGGGPSEALGPMFDEFVDEVRARGSRVAIALLGTSDEASGWLDDYAAPILSRFPEALIEPVWLVDEEEGPISWPAEPEALAGLVVGGGWVPGYLDALMPRRTFITELLRGGLPYLGFSAGAMVVAKHVIAGGWQYQGRQVAPEIAGEGSTELVISDGLGLIGPSIETHADTQFILGRAVAALHMGPMSTVATIDENTALAVETTSGRSHVLGTGQVTWLSKEGDEVVIRAERRAG